MVLKDWRTEAPILEQVFLDYSLSTGLHLNMQKSIWVPLEAITTTQAKAAAATTLQSWHQMAFSFKAKHLGSWLGPEAGQDFWKKPSAKLLERAHFHALLMLSPTI